MLRFALPLVLGLVATTAACKKRASYDTTSPGATIASFEKAVNSGDIPGDLGRLVSSDLERQKWQLRCRTRGCKSASFKVVARGTRSGNKAVLYVDYTVTGKLGGQVIRGKKSPIQFDREGARWLIAQFGAKTVAPPRAPTPPPTDGGVDAK